MEAKAAVFLDKDGTLIPDIPYNINADLITINDGVIEGLHSLQKHFKLIIVSNQSGVAKGFFNISALELLKNKLIDLFKDKQVDIAGFYFCPHDPDGVINPYATTCNCRKPKAGMLFQAAAAHNLDLTQSWMIGDILNDVEAGKSAGCRSILIHNGNETEWDLESSLDRIPNFIAPDFASATAFINQNKNNYDYQGNEHIQKV